VLSVSSILCVLLQAWWPLAVGVALVPSLFHALYHRAPTEPSGRPFVEPVWSGASGGGGGTFMFPALGPAHMCEAWSYNTTKAMPSFVDFGLSATASGDAVVMEVQRIDAFGDDPSNSLMSSLLRFVVLASCVPASPCA
jgi:hypothetical protein